MSEVVPDEQTSTTTVAMVHAENEQSMEEASEHDRR